MSEQPNVVAVAENLTADALHRLLDLAIAGRGRLPGAKAAARQLLEERHDPEAAISSLVNQHVAMAGGQGLLTNWGGLLVSVVTVPANLAAATFVQARMVAGIAHLRGYELADPRVQTSILMVLLGPATTKSLIEGGTLPSSAAAVATAPVYDAALDQTVTTALRDHVLSQLSGKRLGVLVGKRIPLIGGGVGAVVDGWATLTIARHAVEVFVSRRPRLTQRLADQADPDSAEE